MKGSEGVSCTVMDAALIKKENKIFLIYKKFIVIYEEGLPNN
jgi:hypothetical protein